MLTVLTMLTMLTILFTITNYVDHTYNTHKDDAPPDASAPSYIAVGHCCESGDLVTPAPDEPETLLPRGLGGAPLIWHLPLANMAAHVWIDDRLVVRYMHGLTVACIPQLMSRSATSSLSRARVLTAPQ